MRELQLVLSDDLTYHQTGERVPADETVTIGLDSKTRELDLTAENAKKLRELLAPWIEAGHVPGQEQRKDDAQQERGFRGGAFIESRARHKAMRDFADKLGLKSEDGLRPIYVTPGGANYYPTRLKNMYAAHLAAESARSQPRGA